MDNLIERELKRKIRKKQWELTRLIVGLVAWVAAIVLSIVWFGWELFIVITLFQFGNNLGNSIRYDRV